MAVASRLSLPFLGLFLGARHVRPGRAAVRPRGLIRLGQLGPGAALLGEERGVAALLPDRRDRARLGRLAAPHAALHLEFDLESGAVLERAHVEQPDRLPDAGRAGELAAGTQDDLVSGV